MTSRFLLALTAALPLVAGCAEMEYRMWQVSGEPQPGLPRPVKNPWDGVTMPPAPPSEPLPPAAKPPLPFPPARLAPAQAEQALKDDPQALRFLALRTLAEEGLVPLWEALRRKDANMGALLPLTAGKPPAAGLTRPVPPLESVLESFRRLGERNGGPDRDAQFAFLLEQILPARPDDRIILSPHDKDSARKVLARLERLQDAGLISADQRAEEEEAVETLMAALPETLVPPAPPPPPPKVAARKTAKAGTGSVRRLPGGVSGKLEVIPSPAEFEPPKLAAEYKGQAGAHLLSMATAAYGAKAWEALTNQFKQELAGLSHVVQKADLGELGITYRLIVGPMEPTAAERLCGALRAKGQACMPTPFPAAP